MTRDNEDEAAVRGIRRARRRQQSQVCVFFSFAFLNVQKAHCRLFLDMLVATFEKIEGVVGWIF